MTPIVSVENLHRTFRTKGQVVHALRGASMTVATGELVVVRGRSGSGKTTLLRAVGGLDRPTSGAVRVAGQEITALSDADRLALRRTTIGFVFQNFGLLGVLTARENVEVPLRLRRAPVRDRDRRVDAALAAVGLTDRARQHPAELSGGEQQRVAIARALVAEPELLVADEPTGQLDSGTGQAIMTLIRQVVTERGITALVATHDLALMDLADRVLELNDGRLREPAS